MHILYLIIIKKNAYFQRKIIFLDTISNDMICKGSMFNAIFYVIFIFNL